nr:esterase-like activity of phytase family protein [Polaribacter septentrionalilitoris]
MKKTIPFLLFAVLFFACHQSNKTSIVFLDEHVIQDSMQFKNSILGGFSGIDYANNSFYLVVDDAEKPRYVKANIVIQSDKIKNIKFKNVVFL